MKGLRCPQGPFLTSVAPCLPPPLPTMHPGPSPEWGPQHLEPCKGTMQTQAPLSPPCLPPPRSSQLFIGRGLHFEG